MSWWEWIVIAASGVAAGGINAVAGGGSLVSFPTLIALGVPPVSANITNTVALVPGYLGGALAQRRDLASYVSRLRALAVIAAVGGLVGSILLVRLPEDLFAALVPFLILAACALLGAQEMIRRRLQSARPAEDVAEVAALEVGSLEEGGRPLASPFRSPVLLAVLVALASVYGGYFGAGLGIVLLAILGIASDDPLPQLNSLKSTLSLIINLVAAAFFVFGDQVMWNVAAVLAVSSVVGGTVGGRLAGRLSPRHMRRFAIAVGLVVAVKSAV